MDLGLDCAGDIVECLADVKIAVNCELCRRSAFDVASGADDFYRAGDRGAALARFTFTDGS